MKKLLKVYDLTNEIQYFQMIVESMTNGQWSQAFNQFKAMPKENRKNMIKDVLEGHLTGVENSTLVRLIDLI
jgi:hypothetical protein